MSWDQKWEEVFRNKDSWGVYPPEDLIRFVAKNYYRVENRRDIRILEIGCGPGGGPSWYVAREGFSFFGVDGSPTAIELAKERFRKEALPGEFRVGDIETLEWPDGYFDAVVDIACLQHNDEQGTQRIVREVHRVLRTGGRHFSYTAKAGSWGDGKGKKVDATSCVDITEGPYRDMNMGLVRFATRESLLMLYADFQNLNIEYSIRSFDGGEQEITHWILECVK